MSSIKSIDDQFTDIVGQLEVLNEEDVKPKRRRVIVIADLPHLKDYGHESMRELVYGCRFEVAEGDRVLCPPTPLRPSPFEALVVSLDASGHPYKGPVKNLLRNLTREGPSDDRPTT